MAAIGYVRVSTDHQGESGAGLAAQRDAITAFCRKAGLELVATHEDAGVSGAAELADRPGLADAVAKLRKGDTLVIAKRCRLGRDAFAVLMIERAVAKRGASISSADGIGNGDDPASQLLKNMIDAVAVFERSQTRARTRAALAAKRKAGERTGTVPFGWDAAADGRLVPVEAEQLVLRRIMDCRQAGLSLRAIAAILNDESVSTKKGTKWHASTIRSVLNRQAAVAA